jgi:tyrosyl-tRNA synthetase
MKKAAGEAQENPILEYFRYVILPRIESGVSLERKIGGALVVTTYEELEAAYAGGPDVLHPAALKEACARYLDLLIEPVRLHFRDNARARDLQQRVESFRITR